MKDNNRNDCAAREEGVLTLAERGRSDYVIVCGKAPGDPEHTAAEKLQAYLKQICGASLPIVPDETAPAEKEILVGRTNRENAAATVDRGGFTDETLCYFTQGRRLVIGVNDVDSQIRQEAEYAKLLAHAQREANIDALTGVKNRHAYLEAEEALDREIAEHPAQEFAIVIFDVNDLKKINDTLGHHAGDEYIRSACKIICDIFKHSPVFRIGGDEFAVIAQESDYRSIEDLLGQMSVHNAEAMRTGGVVIACGMSKFADDGSVAPVFERADHNMYLNKSNLKAAKNNKMAG